MTDVEMQKAIAEEKRQYHKQWRDKNKDKIKKYNENYWKKKALKKTEERSLTNDRQTENEDCTAGNSGTEKD